MNRDWSFPAPPAGPFEGNSGQGEATPPDTINRPTPSPSGARGECFRDPSAGSPGQAGAGGRLALWALIGTQLITGSTYLVAKIGLAEFEPFALGALRFSLTAVVFLGLQGATGRLRPPSPGDWPLLLRLAAWCIPLNQGLFLYGIRETYAAHGALLYATSPMIVLVMAALLGREPATPGKVLGVTLGFGGVVLVLLQKGLAFPLGSLRGDLIVFAAVVIWSWYTLDNKAALARYDALYLTGMAMILGAIQFLPIGVVALRAQDWAVVTWRGWAAVAYLSLLTSVVSYLVWSWALSRLASVQVAVVSNLQPAVAAAVGWLVLGEPVTGAFVAGTILVGLGVYLTQRG